MKTDKDIDKLWCDIKKYEYALKRKQQELTDLIEKLKPEQCVMPVVSNRRELLIATLHGWQDYKDQGISIEDYVDEIESNL